MKKWKIYAIITLSIGMICLLTTVLGVFNPSFLYNNQTQIGNYTIYHHSPLSSDFEPRLEAMHTLVSQSEFFSDDAQIKLCLNDGSNYPSIMELLRGPAFGWGFFGVAVFRGDADFKQNSISLNGYQWNLEQLFAHEVIHSLQGMKLGILNANPLANHPQWKWEGYPEYIARKNDDQISLFDNITNLITAKENEPSNWGIAFNDGTIAPRSYYEFWVLVQYCLDIKGMTYIELLKDPTLKDEIGQEMMEWYEMTSRANPLIED